MPETNLSDRLPRRFYKTVSIAGEVAPFAVRLDGKPLRTPLKKPLELPSRNLAEAIAAEWRAQEPVIDPSRMFLTKLANTAIDRALAEPSGFIEEIVSFAESDLVCYRAETPHGLRAR